MLSDRPETEAPERSEEAAAFNCAWCRSPLEPGDAAGYTTIPCPRCGARTTWPEPTDAELDRAYGTWYRPASGRFGGPGDRLLRLLRGRLARRLDKIAPEGDILDVGAGDGALLDALAAVGRPAIGLERRSRRPDVREAEVSEVRGRFAAVVLWHSLEHLREAGRQLEGAADLLLPGGVIVIAMPNPGSIQAETFGDRWFALDLPRHLVHVPRDALLARLRSLGLRPTRVSYVRGGQVVFGWLHGLVGMLPGHPDLYDAIRRPEARRDSVSRLGRLGILAAAALLLPIAVACAAFEVIMRRAGTVYVEARHA